MGRRGFVAALLASFILVPAGAFAQAQRRRSYQRPRVTPWTAHEYWRRPAPNTLSYQWWHRQKNRPWHRWKRFPGNIERELEFRYRYDEMWRLRQEIRYYPYLQRPRKSPAMRAWESFLEGLKR